MKDQTRSGYERLSENSAPARPPRILHICSFVRCGSQSSRWPQWRELPGTRSLVGRPFPLSLGWSYVPFLSGRCTRSDTVWFPKLATRLPEIIKETPRENHQLALSIHKTGEVVIHFCFKPLALGLCCHTITDEQNTCQIFFQHLESGASLKFNG